MMEMAESYLFYFGHFAIKVCVCIATICLLLYIHYINHDLDDNPNYDILFYHATILLNDLAN